METGEGRAWRAVFSRRSPSAPQDHGTCLLTGVRTARSITRPVSLVGRLGLACTDRRRLRHRAQAGPATRVPDGCSEFLHSPRAPLCAGAAFCCSWGRETQPLSPPIAVPWGGNTWNPDTREEGERLRAALGSDGRSARTWRLPASPELPAATPSVHR